MTSPVRRRDLAYWAFVGHRLSGLALALFLPLHFLMLGLALEGAGAMDVMLVDTELPLVKAAEWGLVVLLVIHLAFGARILLLEFGTWSDIRDMRAGWIVWGAGAALAIGLIFVTSVM